MDYLSLRRKSFSNFTGDGLDIGPLDKPFIPESTASDMNLNVETVDRWSPQDLERLFPELTNSTFKEPTHIFDVSAGGLGFASDGSYDFVICSHVAEHVANPFWLIQEAFRALRTEGVLYISVPDGRYSDDAGRKCTEYEELLDLFERKVSVVSDGKVLDYLSAPRIKTGWVLEAFENNAVTREVLDHERLRSFHVHVWDSESFVEHFVLFSEHAGLSWQLEDLFVFENNNYECVILVKKTASFLPEQFRQDAHRMMHQRIDEGRHW